eukprot:gene3785-biopygen20311
MPKSSPLETGSGHMVHGRVLDASHTIAFEVTGASRTRPQPFLPALREAAASASPHPPPLPPTESPGLNACAGYCASPQNHGDAQARGPQAPRIGSSPALWSVSNFCEPPSVSTPSVIESP